MWPLSHRLGPTPPLNRLTRLLERLRAEGRPILDLTLSNPTLVGLSPSADVFAALADPAAVRYEPHPRGAPSARRAIAEDYSRRDPACADLDPDRIVLAASTSEAYSLLFKLLCDPGDEILVPAPGYPLFDHLAALEGVCPVPYPLLLDGVWHLDIAALEAVVTPRARALMIVTPHNPTGWVLSRAEHDQVTRLCLGRRLTLIADEVFADYVSAGDPVATAAVAAEEGLRFSLGGLSKSAGLPQLKVAWIVAGGAEREVAASLATLDLITDTYLSVATPQQMALPALMATAPRTRVAIRDRVDRNRRVLGAALEDHSGVTLLPSSGGWSSVLRLPATQSDEEDALQLLENHGVLVHPGYFFDFGPGAWLVVSLLPEGTVFEEGARRIGVWLGERARAGDGSTRRPRSR